MGELDDIVGEFLVETDEGLDVFDRDLLALEQDPDDREALSSIFRVVHTIKGTCGFLGFDRLQELAHAAENLLVRLRERELRMTEEIASALLVTGDALRETLATIERTGSDESEDHAGLLETLGRLREGRDDRLGTLLVRAGKARREDVERAIARQQELGDQRRLGEILVADGTVAPEDIGAVLERQASVRRDGGNGMVRVDPGLLDQLAGLADEFAGVRDGLAVALPAEARDRATVIALARLDEVTERLRDGLVRTRMQRIGGAWAALPRMVRDVAVLCGKRVAVDMEGEDTEVERSIVAAVKDPLTHLVRNAVDHGIERPDERVAAGKPPVGRLSLRALHVGGRVTIEVADDGRGIDLGAVGREAVVHGVVGSGDVERMDARELAALTFAAGLSTASAVTTVSGRGVGLDVVRANVEAIGGTVALRSTPGLGTTVSIEVPDHRPVGKR